MILRAFLVKYKKITDTSFKDKTRNNKLMIWQKNK